MRDDGAESKASGMASTKGLRRKRSRTYRLVFVEDRFGPQKWLEFEAEHPGHALDIGKSEARGRIAELHEDGAFLCSLERSDPANGGLWVVGFDQLVEPSR